MTLSIHDLGAQSLRFIDDYASECERAEDLGPTNSVRRAVRGDRR